MEAVAVGPWGGKGGAPFDDGSSHGGVAKLILYYYSSMLRGISVQYNDGTINVHGSKNGSTSEVDFSEGMLLTLCVCVGSDPTFSGDPNQMGVVAVRLGPLPTFPSYPPSPSATDIVSNLPQIVGLFGRAGDAIDSLGFYLAVGQPCHSE